MIMGPYSFSVASLALFFWGGGEGMMLENDLLFVVFVDTRYVLNRGFMSFLTENVQYDLKYKDLVSA